MRLKRVHLTIAALVILSGFLVLYAFQGRWALFFNDVGLSIAGIFLFNRLYTKLNQNLLSYSLFLLMLILHVAHLYSRTFLVSWDIYMHLIAGFALGAMVSQLFTKEKWSGIKKTCVILLVIMGIGAIHEMTEWTGYAILGEGEGWLLYGEGDEGEWRDTVFDLFFNFVGASAFLLIHRTFKRRKKSNG